MRSECNIFLRIVSAPWKVQCVARDETNKSIPLLILTKSGLRMWAAEQLGFSCLFGETAGSELSHALNLHLAWLCLRPVGDGSNLTFCVRSTWTGVGQIALWHLGLLQGCRGACHLPALSAIWPSWQW
uniref:Uncharacterized protein n=1 Tax=Rousettus aegyptiacus TaxID=9407 RepID=A0A7J8BFG1_ROUAE|nr:hypothetical protein HJG63_009873 [Rousettus aegyptiacus]